VRESPPEIGGDSASGADRWIGNFVKPRQRVLRRLPVAGGCSSGQVGSYVLYQGKRFSKSRNTDGFNISRTGRTR
jgi:hypothetical protein